MKRAKAPKHAKAPKPAPIRLPDPYDLKKQRQQCNTLGFAADYGVAWMEDGLLKHRLLKLAEPVPDIAASHYARCTLMNRGGGWMIAEPKFLEDLFESLPGPRNPQRKCSNTILKDWLQARRAELDAWILGACEQVPEFRGVWETEGAAIRNCELSPLRPETQFTHTLETIAMGFDRLLAVEHLVESHGWDGDAVVRTGEEKIFFQGLKAGYRAGMRLKGARAELANAKVMKMASQTAAGRRPEKRTAWLLAQLGDLEKRLGRKAETLEVIRHLEDKKDPETGEKIWFQALEGDDEKVIQWGEGKHMKVASFAVQISRIRKRQK